MRPSHDPARTQALFDDPNLVPHGGLVASRWLGAAHVQVAVFVSRPGLSPYPAPGVTR